MGDRLLVSAMPPTANGDLHVGHMTGAFFAADVFTRYQRIRGNDVLYFSTADNNQTYVVTTARRLGIAPRKLCAESTEQIRRTLASSNVEIDAFPSPNPGYNEFVRSFVQELFDKGKFTVKEQEVLYCESEGHGAFESYVKGYCPNCLSETVGAICETCAHPNDQDTLIAPVWALEPTLPLKKTRTKVLVFELERYRADLRDFYANKWASTRPHMLQFIDELLAKPLADYPITYPSDYGIPAPFPGFEGNVINVWVEMLPGLMYSSAQAAAARGHAPARFDDLWREGSGYQQIHYLGFDNSFYSGILHVALLMAFEGRYALPKHLIANEFYELEHEKFSTSRRHLIWARDLLKDFTADEMRFYLARTNPEYQRTNFTHADMQQQLDRRLHTPWRKLVAGLNELHRRAGLRAEDTYPVPADYLRHIAGLAQTFERYYAADRFSLLRVTERLCLLLGWLLAEVESQRALKTQPSGRLDPARVAGLWAVLAALSAFSAPILTEFSRRLRRNLGLDPDAVTWPDAEGLAWVQPVLLDPDLLGGPASRARAAPALTATV